MLWNFKIMEEITMKKKTKSMSDIYRQAGRLARELYNDKNHPKGWHKVKAIEELYLTNIAQHFGFAAYFAFSSYSCESMKDLNEKIKADDIYLTKVGIDVYAHPFDWEKVRQAADYKAVNALSWSLHWLGYELDPDAVTFEERKADLLAIADRAQGVVL